MKKSLTFIIGLLAFSVTLVAQPVDIEIDRNVEKYNLGLSQFVLSSKKLPSILKTKTHQTLSKDFSFSNLFNLVSDGPMVNKKAVLSKWSAFGSKLVLAGSIRGQAERIEVSAKLYEVSTGKVVYKTKRKGTAKNIRLLSHQIANDVVEYFTGVRGIFTSKIAFVNDGTGRKELFIADYDAQRMKKLTNDNSIVILPRISPDGEKVVFTSYISGNPDLYLLDVVQMKRQKISSKAGLNVSPSWTPDSQKLAVTLSIDGPPNIYLMNLQGKVLRRLTDGKGADTAPTFSPDGSQIAFTSDRAGDPHIYIVNIDGTDLRRITTEGHCDSAAWSPDGKTILYVKGKGGGRFNIYSIEVLTGIERQLTWNKGDNENPAWAPDSRSIIFTSSRRGKSELFTMNADGTNQKPLRKLRGQSFTPHWSN